MLYLHFIAMTKPSLLNRALIGMIADFSNRYCIFSFSEKEINLIMLSRMSNKKVTEVIQIGYDEIEDMKLSDILISYNLKMKTNDSTMKFQVFKKVGGFPNISNSLNLFKNMYNL